MRDEGDPSLGIVRQPVMFDDEKAIPIHTTEDGVEEFEICAALDEAGIKYLVQPFEDLALDGLFTNVLGHSRISVLENDVQEAMETIGPVVERFRHSDDEEPTETL